MDKKQIIIFAAVAVFAAIRLYQKYNKTSKGQPEKQKGDFSSIGDDYEPYSGK